MENLTDLSLVRNWKQAVVFYVAYVILGTLLGAISGGFSALFFGSTEFQTNFDLGARVGAMVAIIYTLVLGLLVLKSKGLFKNFPSILMILISVLIALFVGNFGGLILIAIMTTFKNGKYSSDIS